MDPQIQPEAGQPEEIMEFSPETVQDGNPYFMGDFALVRFSGGGPSTYWLVDKSNHTVRPFESDAALDAAFGADLQSALQNTMTISPPMIDSGGNIAEGILADFTILGPEFAIRDDGTSKPMEFSQHHLRGRYGKEINENGETLATEVLDGFLNIMKKNQEKTNIPPNFLNQLKNDSQLMAFYVSALAYGDYTLADIYADIGRRFKSSNE